MKKILTVLLLLLTIYCQAQVSNVNDFRVANASTAFGRNLPVGTKIYNVATSEYFVVTTAIVSTATLTTASGSLTSLAGITTETDPIFAADSSKIVHWSDSIAKIATKYDLTTKENTGVASGLVGTHESTYNHSNYNTSYSHTLLTNNPHSVTAAQVGLGNVENAAASGLYEPLFSKNTGFNKNLGTTAGTVLEGRTFGTAANNNTGDFDATGTASGLMTTHTTTHPAPTDRDTRNQIAGTYSTDIHANITALNAVSGTNTGDQIISDATITTTDITTNNFTTAKHGFVPKGTNLGYFLKDDGTWAAAGGGSGTVTSVTAGDGMTQTGTATIDPTLNVVSHAGTAGTIGTINIGADAIGVDLGSTSTTAMRGDNGTAAYNDKINSLAFTGTTTKTLTLTQQDAGTVSNTFTDLVDDADASVTNELQTLTGDVTSSGTTTLTTTIGNDKITEPMLKAVNTPTDEYALTYESTTGDFEWQVMGGGSPGGTTGQVQYNNAGAFAGDADLTFDGEITTIKVQKNVVQSGSKTANWTHDAALGDVGAYRVNLAASTISIHNLVSGMQGTIFLNFVTTTPTTLTVNTFSDAGSTGLTEIQLGSLPTMAINKQTSVTYTCASDGTNTYVSLVYGQEP